MEELNGHRYGGETAAACTLVSPSLVKIKCQNNNDILPSQNPLAAAPPLVKTKHGSLEGFRTRLSNGEFVDIFLGIPYAKPPIGERRFEKPEPVDAWDGIKKATKFGPASFPINFDDLNAAASCPFSEDSLTLNIFRPCIQTTTDEEKDSKAASLLPVMAYVHGGGFCSGNACDYGYERWSENFVDRGIIVVTIQYRLGPLGFLALKNDVLAGNFGLWDQAMALRFLHENIRAFGGDSTKITAVGLSAGGASVAALSLSPHSRDYICATVEMSGTVLPEWSASDRTMEASAKLIECLLNEAPMDLEKLTAEKAREIKSRLKKLSLEDFKRALRATGTSRYDLNLLKFGPRIDGDFFPRDFPILLREQIGSKPSLMGLTENEALYFAIQGKDRFLNDFPIEKTKLETFNEPAFRGFVRNCVVGGQFAKYLDKRPPKLLEEATKEICQFYLNDSIKNGSRDFRFFLKAYSMLLSDVLFNVPIFWMAELRQQLGKSTFLYFNEYFNANQFEQWIPLKASTHGNEYPYLNGLFPVGDFKFTKCDEQHRNLIVSMISGFVKSGTPSFPTDQEALVSWPQNCIAEAEQKPKFVRISKENVLSISEIETVRKSVDFWTEFSKKYEFNLIRGIPNKC